MIVQIELFAGAKEAMGGTDIVNVEVHDEASAADVLMALSNQHPPLAGLASRSRLAVDHAYVGDDDSIESTSNVALIPPVSGG
ncbi:MAG: MoaD/ThiS family protein [Planctomycetota bacterium]